MSLLEQQHQLFEQPTDALGVGARARHRDLVAADVDRHGKRGLDEAQQLVTLAEQLDHVVVARNEHLELGGRRRGHVTASVAAG
jgi:hypothetical protein